MIPASTLVTNAAAYQFVPLSDLAALRQQLIDACSAADLRGTILLASEGINLFIAGQGDAVERVLSTIRSIDGLSALSVKLSFCEHQPFKRMLVKIKKEIIAFGMPGIDPARAPAPRLAPKQLKQWLDQGRDIVLLDTRNDYEVKLGTFRGARVVDIGNFRQFPDAVAALPSEMKQQVVVSFCTGGIRCEKAAPFLQQQGFANVYQLDGGILKYFEECGNAHYQGDCFVFDQRVGVDPALAPADAARCAHCQDPIVDGEVDAEIDPDGSHTCGRCRRRGMTDYAALLAVRAAKWQEVCSPLPGHAPYDNFRPIKIGAQYDRWIFSAALADMFSHLTANYWTAAFTAGRVLRTSADPLRDQQTVAADQIVRAGERYLHWQPQTTEPDVDTRLQFLHEDDALIVVCKPAPMPMHASGRFNRNTLANLLAKVYAPEQPRLVHRLDANTTGVAVLTKTRQAARMVQAQFERSAVQKRYLARVVGHPSDDDFSSSAAIAVAPGDLGSRTVDLVDGLPAHTDFAVLRRDPDGTALIAAMPRTGRTNQIRVHLWQLGYPIVGDQTYLPKLQVGQTQTRDIDDAPLCLHAHRIGFLHPITQLFCQYEAPEPAWAV
jgi:UPF0176 protein